MATITQKNRLISGEVGWMKGDRKTSYFKIIAQLTTRSILNVIHTPEMLPKSPEERYETA